MTRYILDIERKINEKKTKNISLNNKRMKLTAAQNEVKMILAQSQLREQLL
jgi:hypothetical protein